MGVTEVEKKGKAVTFTSDDEEDDSEEGDDDVVTPSVISREGFFEMERSSSRDKYATVKPNKSGMWLQKHIRGISDNTRGLTRPQGKQTTDEPSLSIQPEEVIPPTSTDHKLTAEERWHEATKAELEEKVVKETARQYSRGEMLYSYDFDLTTPLQRKQDRLEASGKERAKPASSAAAKGSQSKVQFAEPLPTLPLWRRADSRFWHNEALSRDFVEAGLHGLVLPLMQGYFQVTTLPLNAGATPQSEEEADPMDVVSQAASSIRVEAQLLVISRRSKERAGLRYQRRGVNEKGQVANYVETEQILYIRRGEKEHHALSFLQFRGSIPQYWKQDPFNLKPPPVLERSALENKAACSKHFEAQLSRFGKVICVNLAEQHGKEGAITKAYKDAVKSLDTDKVQYRGFDFHEECKGMKFENVSKLIDELKDKEMQEMDCFWKSVAEGQAGETVYSRQKSAFRVSCLDCLDRTNVVQSAFARYLLGVQLQRLGIALDSSPHHNEEFDFAFNNAWADNGDMVSQIYAGTRALKGDFTRTGKRNIRGMMNDATNSVYRMVQGAVTDFFKQTVIDFQYGQTSLAALERYNDELAAQDPSEVHRLARVRISAIETCAKDILSAEEQKKSSGWTLFSPIEQNRITSPTLEEKVVLLTEKALYVCSYDFTTELLMAFSKINVGDIIGIQKGIYIVSPNEGYHPENHWGLLVEYLAEERRLNTASMKSLPTAKELEVSAANKKFIAFRAVVDDFASLHPSPPLASSKKNKGFFQRVNVTEDSLPPLTSHALVDEIVTALSAQCSAAGAYDPDDIDVHFIKEETIQSLAQAKANASLFQPLIEGIKRRLWL
jgi:hypothetical protein